MNMHLNMRRPTFSLLPARFRSDPTPPPPPIPSKRPASSVIPPIPPTNNPRGELIFSNRVDRHFKEGYERYRAAFERRREERLKETNTGRRWIWFGRKNAAKTGGVAKTSAPMVRRDTPPSRETRTPSPSRASGRSHSPTIGSRLRPEEEEKPMIPPHVFDSGTEKGNRGRAESYSFVFSGTERLRPGP